MVCLDTPTSRATSSTARPASTCFKALIISASLCLPLDMVLPLSFDEIIFNFVRNQGSRSLTCAFDECAVTAEIKKGKYVYYHCTGYRGKCDLPYMREEVMGERLGQILKNIQIPDDILRQLQDSLRQDSKQIQEETA